MATAPFPAERASLAVLLRHARETYGAVLRAALDAAGYDDLPKNGLYVLGGLTGPAGGRPLSQLIDELSMPKQSTGQLVDALVVRGYLRRDVDQADRRKLTIGLTARGRAAGRVLVAARDALDAELAERVGVPDVATTRRVLAVLVALGRDRALALDA